MVVPYINKQTRNTNILSTTRIQPTTKQPRHQHDFVAVTAIADISNTQHTTIYYIHGHTLIL